jgi:hypothetical protein
MEAVFNRGRYEVFDSDCHTRVRVQKQIDDNEIGVIDL